MDSKPYEPPTAPGFPAAPPPGGQWQPQQQPAGMPQALPPPSYPAMMPYPVAVHRTDEAILEYRLDHGQGLVLLEHLEVPVRMYCPYCNGVVVTEVRRRPGVLAWLCSFTLCLTCCWPCFFLPFCTRGCLDKQHRCGRCGRTLAIVPA